MFLSVCHRHQCMDHNSVCYDSGDTVSSGTLNSTIPYHMTVESDYSVKSGALRPQQKIIIIINSDFVGDVSFCTTSQATPT